MVGNVVVQFDPPVVEADLDGRGFVFEAALDDPQDIVQAALDPVAADGSVERQGGFPGAAEELVDRLAEHLSLDVPERDVDGGKRAGERAVRSQLDEFVEQPVVQDGVVERVAADRLRRDVVDDHAERREPAPHRRRLADAMKAVVGPDTDESAARIRHALVRPFHLEGFDAVDLHVPALRLIVVRVGCPRGGRLRCRATQ